MRVPGIPPARKAPAPRPPPPPRSIPGASRGRRVSAAFLTSPSLEIHKTCMLKNVEEGRSACLTIRPPGLGLAAHTVSWRGGGGAGGGRPKRKRPRFAEEGGLCQPTAGRSDSSLSLGLRRRLPGRSQTGGPHDRQRGGTPCGPGLASVQQRPGCDLPVSTGRGRGTPRPRGRQRSARVGPARERRNKKRGASSVLFSPRCPNIISAWRQRAVINGRFPFPLCYVFPVGCVSHSWRTTHLGC